MLEVGDIEAQVVRKPIKNLYLSVLSPYGKVRVTAPLAMKDAAIRSLLATRLIWIRKKQKKFEGLKIQARREYVSGESHYLWGRPYRLEVVYENRPSGVSIKDEDKIVLSVKPNSNRAKRAQVMLDWYRKELGNAAGVFLQRWQKTMDIRVNSCRIKKMKTRWGSCNHKAGRIWLNLELAKKPEHCLDFIIVHEMTHLLEKGHNSRFKAHMDTFMPLWRQRNKELKRSVLSHEHSRV